MGKTEPVEQKTFKHLKIDFDFHDLEVITEETGRRYKAPNGKWFPSITTVTGLAAMEGISAWKEMVGEKYADQKKKLGGLRGNRFHDFAEKYLKNENPSITELPFLERQMFRNTKPYLDRIDKIVVQEKPLYSYDLEVAGRVDCIGYFDDVLSVIDFKTADKWKEIHHVEHYLMQASGYSFMFEEMTGVKITNLVLIIATEHEGTQIITSKRHYHMKDLRKWREVHRLQKGF